VSGPAGPGAGGDPGDGAQDVLALAAQVLRSRGERLSGPRAAVLRVLSERRAGDGGRPDHLSAEQVVAAVAEQAPQVHRASVYRALDALSRHELVRHVHMGHGATTYHLGHPGHPGHPDRTGGARPDAAHDHLHARCRRCGRVVDLPGDLLDAAADRLADELGFALDPGHVALSGTCADCAGTPAGDHDPP
jgi:Fur family transcriptional regulator, ferric uptake regulator